MKSGVFATFFANQINKSSIHFAFLGLRIPFDILIELQSAKFKQAMQKKLLRPQTLFLIATQINNELFYLSNESSLTNTVQLEKNLRYSNIASFLFEVEQNNIYDKKLAQRFYEPLLIRHKYSNKFLNFVEEMGDRNHQGCRLGLSHEKVRWTMLPCYKYQVKNTLNVCFSERVYISQENIHQSSTKNMFVKQYVDGNNKTYDLLFGFHFQSQMILIKYHENNQHNYHFGQYLKVYHQESYSFLVDSSPVNKIFNAQQQPNEEKFAVAFKNQEENIGETLLDCIWSLEEAIDIKGSYSINGLIKTNLEVRLKNPLTDNYLTLMDNSTDDQNYNMVGQQQSSIYSVFLLQPVREAIKIVTKDAQIRMKQTKIYQYMAVSPYRQSHALIDILMDRIAQDEHFYEFKPIKQELQITIFFLVSIKKELQKIKAILAQDYVKKSILETIKGIYLSLYQDLKILEKDEANIEILQKQLRHFIPLTVKILTRLQTILEKVVDNRQILLEIMKFNYIFLFQIVKQQESTKIIAFRYIHIFLRNIFQQLFVEELLIEMFKDNMSLLSRASEVNSFMGCNLIQGIFKNIAIADRNTLYLKKIMKIITLLLTLVRVYDSFIDINQRLIVIELFGEKRRFDQLLFPIQIRKSHVYINHPTTNVETPINNLQEQSTVQLIVKTLSFISSLCEDRNIISKKLISDYLCRGEERPEDLKFIINCFYIKGDFSLRAMMLLLLANLYVDSFPRIARYSPVAVIKMDIESMRIKNVSNADTEIAELSARLKDSIMQKAERSYSSRPLNTNAFESQKSSIMKAQPTFTQNQLNEYKKIIILLLQTEEWNIQILRILRMLLNLEVLDSEQRVNIYSQIFDKIALYGKDSEVIKEVLLLLEDIIKYLQEDTLERANIYFILMHYKQKTKIQEIDVKYLISNDQLITFGNQAQNHTNKYIALKYNESSAKTGNYYKQIKKVQPILQTFLDNTYDPQTMLKFLFNIKLIFTPCYQTVHLLLNTSIISQMDLDQYELLQSYSIQINNLTKISEEWLCNHDENSQDYLRFSDLMTQVTNYLYDDYMLDSYDSKNYRKKHRINKNRQSIIKNIGVHTYILSLLNTNYYLLEGESLRSLSKKIRQTFEKCFSFLYQFCFDCEENKQLMISQMGIIKKFMSVLETGQTQFWILLIKNRKKLIQETQLEDFQRLFFKIIKDRDSVSGINCDYNPLYIQQLMALIDINGKPFRPNIDKIAKVLSQPLVFKKILYLSQQKKKRMEFCVQLYKLRIDPTQIPVIYQTKVLQFLIYIMKELGSKNSFMKRSLKSIISLDYIFSLLSEDDSFLFQGIPTDITFIFKIQLLRLLQIYLFTKDIEPQVYSCVQLTKFLKYYKTIFTINQKRKLSMVDNQMLYYSYIQRYEEIIDYYVRNNSQFYNKYLKRNLIRLLEILQKVPEKEADYNYQLVVLLLDESQLSNFKKDPLLKRLEKERDIYYKWSNFTIMSENSSEHEKTAKNQLFQLLKHQKTAQILQVQKVKFFQALQAMENKFINRICVIIQSLHENFQIFHQEPTYQLVFLCYQFIKHKTNKKEKPFSIEPPKLRLQKSFRKLVLPLVKLLCNKSFDFNRIFCRKIFYYSLNIIYMILSFEKSFQLHEQILNYLNASTSKGLLDCIKITLLQAMEQQKIESLVQEINVSQEELHLITQENKIHLILPSLLFIKQVCRLSSFTSFLRFQENTVNTIDMLDLIYTNLLFILSKETNQVNMFMIERVEYLCQSIVAFFTGCNKQNQLFVVNKQFIKYAEKFLKIDKIKLKQSNKDDMQALILKVSENYKSTIPEYRHILQKEGNYFRFSHHFPTDCVKASLVKVFLATTVANETAMQKLRSFMSLQLLKLNIIIAYQDLLQEDIKQQRFFLEKFENWREVFENPEEYKVSLVFPVYALALIFVLQEEVFSKQQTSSKGSANNDDQCQQHIQDILPPSIKLLLKQLKDEPFFRDILLFYQKYFESYKFFKPFISNIEVYLGNDNKIVNITFPKLPISNQIDEIFQYELQHSINRLNQQEKNKSFLILAQKFYEQIQGQCQFNAVLFKGKECIAHLLNIFEKSQKFNITFCLLNILITVFYLVCNYQHYSDGSSLAYFQTESFSFYQPQTITRGFLLFFEIINIILCILLIAFVVLKKLPFYLYIHLKSYHKLQPKDRTGFAKYQITYGIYEVIKTIFLDIYLILFVLLSISHPIFCCFIIIYIATRLQTGKLLLRMASQLAFDFLAVSGVLLVLNLLYAVAIYINFTVGTSYGGECVNIFVCMKLLMDQILKGGFVTWLPSNYINNSVDGQFFMEYSYNLLIPGILMSIYRGLLIDKITFLRQNNQLIEKDEKTKCFICGQSQFQIDLNLQGFERHLSQTHNRKNYIGFMFYLRRKQNGKFLFYEDLVRNSISRLDYSWIPLEASIQKQRFCADQQVIKNVKEKMVTFLQDKRDQFKQTLFNAIRAKNEITQIFKTQEEDRKTFAALFNNSFLFKSQYDANSSFS